MRKAHVKLNINNVLKIKIIIRNKLIPTVNKLC